MYIKDGIAYAGEPKQPLKISGVRPAPQLPALGAVQHWRGKSI